MTEQLQYKLQNIPTKPGIYQYLNANGKIIYIGKAKNLRNRVKSYFQDGRPVDAKTKAMVSKIADVEFILVDSEAEALLLEDTLIKKHQPRYNILLKDDKSYPYIRVTKEEYPKIFMTRNIIRDGSRYFGPYTDLLNAKLLIKTIRNVFQIRTCNLALTRDTITDNKYKICLDFHIDKCSGPCENHISFDDYNDKIKQATRILQGRTKELEKELKSKMELLSEDLKFEEAALVRNQLLMLQKYTSKQKIISADFVDRDILGIARDGDLVCTLMLKIRDGKLIGKRHFIVKDAQDIADSKIVQRTLERWYLETDFIPKEIFVPEEPEDLEYITEWLRKKKEGAIHIYIPKLGEKKSIVDMAITNASFLLKEYQIAIEKREQVIPRSVLSLQRDLRMAKPPRRIECFDNSHIQGSELVSSMVLFEDGKPKKSEYRKYKNKTVLSNNDFAAMEEVVSRRYTRLKNELDYEEHTPLPDLIIIDGGKGQLSSAYSILKELGLEKKITVVGLAKKLEEVFFPGESDPLILPRTSSSLKLIQQLRDEAHRFAITFHRQLRSKRTFKTELTEIPAIGDATAKKLLKLFGSVESIKNATLEQLAEHVNKKVARNVFDHFKTEEESN